MQLTRWLVVSIVASLLMLAACGDDDDDDSTGGNGATAVPAATDVIVDTPSDDSMDADGDDDGDGDGDDDGGDIFQLAGEWVGGWNNDTFGSSAPITMSITVNEDGTASFTFGLSDTAEGAPFGVPGLSPRTFEGTHDDAGLTVTVRGDDLFGDMDVTISPDGDLVAEATMDGLPGITGLSVEGSFDGSGMNITYTVGFPDGSSASGSATLTKL